jgi:hypothetical protein
MLRTLYHTETDGKDPLPVLVEKMTMFFPQTQTRLAPPHNNYSHTTQELINCPRGLSRIVKEPDGVKDTDISILVGESSILIHV